MSSIAPPTSSRAAANPDSVILRAQGVRKGYRIGEEDLIVLQQVDLTLRRGEFVAIEGRSGSGKSTLLHILGGLDSPSSGALKFDGEEYTSNPTPFLMFRLAKLLPFNQLGRMVTYAAFILIVLLAYEMFAPPAALYGRYFLAELSVAIIAVTLYLRWELRLFLLADFWFIVGLLMFSGQVLHSWIAAPIILSALLVAIFLYLVISSLIVELPVCRLRNKEFGFVFQFYHLLPELNVLENTLVSPLIEKSWFGYFQNKAERIARAKQLLEDLGLGHRLNHKPNQLSGGERQRVAIARALMNSPKVLFADEPTGNLDYETGRQIMAVLEKLHREKNQTIVMVTHDRSLASQADRVLVLRNGKLEKPDET